MRLTKTHIKFVLTFIILVLFALIAASGAALVAQPAPPTSVDFLGAPPPPPVSGVSASSTTSGNSTYCWWVVATYPIGAGAVSNPACRTGIAPLSASGPVTVSWTAMSYATSYRVLRTTSSTYPSGTCVGCSITTTASTSFSDTGAAGTDFNQNAAVGAKYSLSLDNLTGSAPVVRTTLGTINGTQPQVIGTPTAGTCAQFAANGNLDSTNLPCAVQSAAVTPVVSSTFAARGVCAAANEGQTAVYTNSILTAYCLSAAWVDTYLNQRLTLPSIAGTWINQGTSTITNTGGYAVLTPQQGAGGNNIRIQVFALPATPFTVTLRYATTGFMQGYDTCGLYLRQSSDGKLILLTSGAREGGSGNTVGYAVQKYTNPTTFSANYSTSPWYGQIGTYPPMSAVRISDNGTTRTYQVSYDGFNWATVTTNGHTDFMTADQYGYGCDSHGAGNALVGLFFSLGVV